MSEPTKQNLIVPAELAQAILNYLQTRPFNEVHELITMLVRCQLQPAAVSPPAEKGDD